MRHYPETSRRIDTTADSGHQGSGSPPAFRRATPEDALQLARATFGAEDRVDMGTLATQLSVSRATLHRWFGTRDRLLERMLVDLTDEFAAGAQVELKDKGLARILEFVERMIGSTIEFAPARAFVRREPQLALRLLISPHGDVHAAIVRTILAVAAAEPSGAPGGAIVAEADVRAAVHVGTTLQWATFAIGEEPPRERVLEIVAAFLAGRGAS
jgi:AcrR family transcriptional regulator